MDSTSTADPAPADSGRLLLIDGHSVAYRAFFALPVENFSTTTGQHTNAVYGFTSMLINVLRDEQPTHVAVAFDVSRKTFRSEEYADYKANRSQAPDEFAGQIGADQGGPRRAAHHVPRDRGLRGRRHHRAPWPRRAERDGLRGAHLHRRPRRASSSSPTDVTVLYPVQGRLGAGADDPEAVAGEVRRRAASATPTSPRWWARPATTCRASRASGPKTAAKWLAQYGGLDGVWSRDVDKITGKAGESLRDHLGEVLPQPPLNAARPRPRPPRQPRRPRAASRGTATRCTRSSTASSSGCCATGCSQTLSTAEPRGRGGLRGRAARVLGPGERRRLARRRTRRRACRCRTCRRRVGPRHRSSRRAGARDGRRRCARGSTSTDPRRRTTRRRWPRGWPTPSGPRCCTTPRARCSRCAPGAGRWRGVASDTALAAYLVPPRPAVLRPRRPRRCATCTASCGSRTPTATSGSCSTLDATTAAAARTRCVQARGGRSSSAARLDAELDEPRRRRRCSRDVELPLVDVLADMEQTGIAVDAEHLADARGASSPTQRAARPRTRRTT